MKSCEEVVYYFKTGSFSALARAIGRLKGVKEITAFKMLGWLKEDNLFSDLGKEGRLETGLEFFKFSVSREFFFDSGRFEYRGKAACEKRVINN